MSTRYQLIVRNGTIVDPSAGLHEVRDIACLDGRIAMVERGISSDAEQVIDAAGLLVVPGLVDLHAHVWSGVTNLAVDADRDCLARGVTTVVDAGSSGANTFPGFRRYVMEAAQARILGFLNVSAMGLVDDGFGEMPDVRWADVDRAVAVARANRDHIVGIKVRLSQSICGANCSAALDRALQAAQEIGRPVMVHIGGTERPLGEILDRLRPGDIVTHCFTGWKPGIIADNGRVIPEAVAARRRGVLFDVGHGAGSFTFDYAARALEDGFAPDSISTDLHQGNLEGPVFDLATTLSKFLYLGVPLETVIAMATRNPAAAIGQSEACGALLPGMPADIAILRHAEEPVTFIDTAGERRAGTGRLVPLRTIRFGRVVAEPIQR